MANSHCPRGRPSCIVALAIFAALGREQSIAYVDMPAEPMDRYQNYSQADIVKIRQVGLTARITSLEDAMQDYVSQYLVPGKYLAT